MTTPAETPGVPLWKYSQCLYHSLGQAITVDGPPTHVAIDISPEAVVALRERLVSSLVWVPGINVERVTDLVLAELLGIEASEKA